MSFLRPRRSSLSGSLPILEITPNNTSIEPVKTSRQRGKTVSSTNAPELQGTQQTGGVERVDNKNGLPRGGKGDNQTGCSQHKLGQDKRRNERSGEAECETTNGYPTETFQSNPPKGPMLPLERERRQLAEAKAKLEAEVKENTEFLRLLQGRREKVAAQGEQLRRSISPEIQPRDSTASPYFKSRLNAKPQSRYTTPGLETPPSSGPPSPARRACQEAYAKMSPLQRHLMRDKMRDGVRGRDTRREEDEHRDWEEYQRSRNQGEREAREREQRRRMQEMRVEVAQLEHSWRNREQRKAAEAWEAYEARWTLLLTSSPSIVRFTEIPWPVVPVFIEMPHAASGLGRWFVPEAITTFIFSPYHSGSKTRKQRLHDALLRYHPDRFEARWLHKIPKTDGERDCVREAVGLVARILGNLLHEEH